MNIKRMIGIVLSMVMIPYLVACSNTKDSANEVAKVNSSPTKSSTSPSTNQQPIHRKRLQSCI